MRPPNPVFLDVINETDRMCQAYAALLRNAPQGGRASSECAIAHQRTVALITALARACIVDGCWVAVISERYPGLMHRLTPEIERLRCVRDEGAKDVSVDAAEFEAPVIVTQKDLRRKEAQSRRKTRGTIESDLRCTNDPDHGYSRYVISGKCVECIKKYRDAFRLRREMISL